MSIKTVTTRMAPSPTGEFHIGGMRTLLYNWAYAKQNKGQFILRIEDTDRVRLVEGATERILQDIADYGFSWDQGPEVGGPNGPYIQSERLELYKKYSEQLIENGKAYYCFCTADRLTQMREEQMKKGISSTKYDRHCLHLTKEEISQKLKNKESFVIRLKVPEGKKVSWIDGVLGNVSFDSNEIDDQVLLKSDGFPTYHLGVVVDDHLMGVTHVMRGNEWLPSTPKHLLIYEAFDWTPPIHFHLPNLKELGGTKKLSKRFGPVSARGFLEDGYLAEAIVNYLMFLGWNPGTEKELYTMEEFVRDFDVTKIHKTDLVAFDRAKLDWFNAQYISRKSDSELAKLLIKYSPEGADLSILSKISPLVKTRMKRLSDFSETAKYFFEDPKVDTSLLSKDNKKHLDFAIKALSVIENYTIAAIGDALLGVCDTQQFKRGDFFMDLRVALTGKKVSPPLNESMEIIGKERVLSRLQNVLQ